MTVRLVAREPTGDGRVRLVFADERGIRHVADLREEMAADPEMVERVRQLIERGETLSWRRAIRGS